MKNRKLIDSISVESDSLNLSEMLKRFPLGKIRLIAATGCGSSKLSEKLKGIPVMKIDEIKAIGLGGKFISNKERILVVSVGSGTCIVSVKRKIRHVAGIPMGGATVSGLSKLLLGIEDCKKVLRLAKGGNLSGVDLLMKEIYPYGIGFLDSRGSASHFGRIIKPSKQDLALAIINMVAQAVGTIAALAARLEDQKNVVFIGKLVESKLVQRIIEERMLRLCRVKMIVPKNAGIATAMGATLVSSDVLNQI
jgi:type II pantothenate kinase